MSTPHLRLNGLAYTRSRAGEVRLTWPSLLRWHFRHTLAGWKARRSTRRHARRLRKLQRLARSRGEGR